MGMPKDWLGQNLAECHGRINESDDCKQKITLELFKRFESYFQEAISEVEVEESVKEEFMILINDYADNITSGQSNMN